MDDSLFVPVLVSLQGRKYLKGKLVLSVRIQVISVLVFTNVNPIYPGPVPTRLFRSKRLLSTTVSRSTFPDPILRKDRPQVGHTPCRTCVGPWSSLVLRIFLDFSVSPVRLPTPLRTHPTVSSPPTSRFQGDSKILSSFLPGWVGNATGRAQILYSVRGPVGTHGRRKRRTRPSSGVLGLSRPLCSFE